MPDVGELTDRRILLIEDDFLVGETILALLEEEGARVTWAGRLG